MKDKIVRLSKGITEIETPVMEITPGSVFDTFVLGRDAGFIIELLSTNGISMKGICFADDPRITADAVSFVGRRVHVTFHISTSGITPGYNMTGTVEFVTNGGEFSIPYSFGFVENVSLAGQAGNDPAAFFIGNGEAPAFISDDFVSENPLKVSYALTDRTNTAEDQTCDPEESILLENLPEDEELFAAVLTALIRSENNSRYAFAVYREAIRRGINITRLYESYVYAYPEDSDEPMPREVLLYFSYENDADRSILRKLYKNIILHVDKDSELYYEYESAMSHYAAESALLRYIDSGLEVIYDRMIVPGMIDMKAAAVLPDIFKAARIKLISGTADHLIVKYPGLRTGVRAMLHNGTAYVPVYFKDAEIRFFRSGDTPLDVTAEVTYSCDYVFDRPDIIRRCFELVPEHRMLLLSAAREADRAGIHSEDEKDIVVRALHELDISPDFRAELISDLCAFGGSLNWLDVLDRSDYKSASGRRLFSLLTEGGELKKAYETLNICGIENVGTEAALRFAGETIRQNCIPGKDGKIDPYFTGLCKYLYDNGRTDADVLSFLTREYEGNSEEMFRIMQSAAKSGAGLNDLPEKIVTVKLFADSSAHIDEAFEAYIENCDYTELILRAYFTVRCTDVFINDDGKDHHILFDTLNSYIRAVEDPAALPVIYQLAITKYYSEKEDMDEKELKICQKLTDELIGQGLVFCYTKKLRKKIRVPEEICRRFYVEYHAASDEPPKMLARVVPDEEDYHVADMKRVYRNIYVMSAILFKGDELQYIIYDNSHEKKAAEEGIITVKKFHRQNDDLFEDLNAMTRAIEEKDIDELRERMLSFAEHKELIKELFSLENQHVTEHWS